MNHWQPEVGGGPRGGFDFSGNVTGASGYQPVGGFNGYAAFLLGLSSSYGKSVQAEEMTTREWQHGLYIRDRWQVSDKLTVNGGLRFEILPDDDPRRPRHRASRLQHVERPDWRRGGNPSDVGVRGKPVYVAPRIGAAYRIDDNTVFRTGYGITVNPLPCRGRCAASTRRRLRTATLPPDSTTSGRWNRASHQSPFRT